jgi:putative SOS response-associated peptidase YedK
MLQEDDMPVYDAPEDEGPRAPRQSYNFAPGYHGIVYRADVPDRGAGPAREHGSGSKKRKTHTAVAAAQSNDDEGVESTTADKGEGEPAATAAETAEHHQHHDPKHYILQSMKWGLVPSWTKRSPGYGSLMKTINCRDDSLSQPGGMWSSMKARKRCVVVAQGFYEWLKVGPKEKVPHFVKRKDGRLMCFAGLWDCVRYEGEGEEEEVQYTYTVITTDSNERLKFLHDRMPVILDPGSKEMGVWLDPGRYEWTRELQEVLKPYKGELEVYPVSKEVGKVGNNSPSFVVPVASRENKSNIANFFAKGKKKEEGGKGEPEVEVEKKEGREVKREAESVAEVLEEANHGVKIEPQGEGAKGRKREASSPLNEEEPPAKKGSAVVTSPTKTKEASPMKKSQGRGKISATTNVGKSPAKGKGGAKVKAEQGSQKITKFFANSA